GGQHGRGLVKGPVAGNVECLSHGGFIGREIPLVNPRFRLDSPLLRLDSPLLRLDSPLIDAQPFVIAARFSPELIELLEQEGLRPFFR
ncbi:hypothetical protein, partial [Paracoccus pantotrophus]|uniref:hypothetical protein n=1 Tax=Paracoccus pantotrophus TaxID=82367 RepID=UPI001C68B2CC